MINLLIQANDLNCLHPLLSLYLHSSLLLDTLLVHPAQTLYSTCIDSEILVEMIVGAKCPRGRGDRVADVLPIASGAEPSAGSTATELSDRGRLQHVTLKLSLHSNALIISQPATPIAAAVRLYESLAGTLSRRILTDLSQQY